MQNHFITSDDSESVVLGLVDWTTGIGIGTSTFPTEDISVIGSGSPVLSDRLYPMKFFMSNKV